MLKLEYSHRNNCNTPPPSRLNIFIFFLYKYLLLSHYPYQEACETCTYFSYLSDLDSMLTNKPKFIVTEWRNIYKILFEVHFSLASVQIIIDIVAKPTTSIYNVRCFTLSLVIFLHLYPPPPPFHSRISYRCSLFLK